MKTSITLLFALLLLSACKKEEQPVPGAFGRITEFGTVNPLARSLPLSSERRYPLGRFFKPIRTVGAVSDRLFSLNFKNAYEY